MTVPSKLNIGGRRFLVDWTKTQNPWRRNIFLKLKIFTQRNSYHYGLNSLSTSDSVLQLKWNINSCYPPLMMVMRVYTIIYKMIHRGELNTAQQPEPSEVTTRDLLEIFISKFIYHHLIHFSSILWLSAVFLMLFLLHYMNIYLISIHPSSYSLSQSQSHSSIRHRLSRLFIFFIFYNFLRSPTHMLREYV